MLLCTMLLPVAAHAADSVKLGTFWIEDVTVRGFDNNSIVFTTDTGAERVVPLEDLQGVRSTVESELTEAEAALNADDKQQALRHFRAAASGTRRAWVKQWAGWKQVVLLDEIGEPGEAVRAYLALARMDVEPYFLNSPPVAAIRRAEDGRLDDLREQIEQARREAQGAAADQLDALLKAIDMPATASAAAASTAAEGAVVLPSAMQGDDDPVTALLREGRFEEVEQRATRRLQSPEPLMAKRLYQLGVAQLHLAMRQQQRDGELSEAARSMYLDAGLNLMHVPIYFSRSPYKGPALIEAGLVHERIGKHDVAMNLWSKAQVEVDPEADPQLIERLNNLMGIEIESIEEQGILKSN